MLSESVHKSSTSTFRLPLVSKYKIQIGHSERDIISGSGSSYSKNFKSAISHVILSQLWKNDFIFLKYYITYFLSLF